MTYASDQKNGTDGLSATSRRLLALRERVFDEWERRVRASFDKASELAGPLLIDTLPAFYDNLAESVTQDYPRRVATEGSTLAAEHGGERARVTAYDVEALIGEYQAFRSTIFDVLHAEGVALTHQEMRAINMSIDAAIQEAVTAFTLVHAELREQFAAALTHDLRNPLGVASTALELILALDDPAAIKAVAARALDNVHRMDVMIHDLLDTMVSHGGSLPLELTSFDILGVAREVAADHGGRVHCSGSSVTGWWDRPALKRALENLVRNALKYGDERGRITIDVQAVRGRLVLTVHNEGQPIAAEEQASIFEMYRRAKSAAATRQQGWGIGLPYVRAVAEAHAGSIGLDSTAERGTTFMIDIPVDCRPYINVSSVA